MNQKSGDDMEAERRTAELVAQTVIARLLDMAKDKKIAADVMDVWGGEIDRTIGRGLRRALWYLFVALAGIASLKFGLLDKFLGMLKP